MAGDLNNKFDAHLRAERRKELVAAARLAVPVVLAFSLAILVLIPFGPSSYRPATVLGVEHMAGGDSGSRQVHLELDGKEYRLRTKDRRLMIEVGQPVCVQASQFSPTSYVRFTLATMSICNFRES